MGQQVIKVQTPQGERQAVDVPFDVETPERWCEYRMADGGVVRVKAVAKKIFWFVDEDGRKLYDELGCPQVFVIWDGLATSGG